MKRPEPLSARLRSGLVNAPAGFSASGVFCNALALYATLRSAGVGARVSPTPRQARSECGSALLVDCDDRTRIESLAAAQGLAFQRIVELERQIDASRDRFC